MRATLQPAPVGIVHRVIQACGPLGLAVGLLAGVVSYLMIGYGSALMACGYEPLSFVVGVGWQCTTTNGVAPLPDLLWSVVSVLVAVVVWTGIGALLGRLMRDPDASP
jgi:hypothetical protein